ncbi:Eukaryotic protein of unknown function (DUF846), putative [Angomonas deanei]|uniref:Golgi apparatus membrane protein TVP23 homolog n=1 Tax=Angomonas deanei TaxID=59799 RepID=A0A7G2CPR4_9TRYP|nr:Eukaryotic protein of unknown function (DUF846), putative [Angomonas deanei]
MSNNNNNVNAETNGATVPAEDTRTYKGVHPIAALFHVIFKLAALLMFIFGKLFSANYIVMFVITVLLCAADFWVTKNVTGRILVALRWWNQVNEDGTSQWVFESAPDNDNRVNSYDRWFFWIVLGGYTVIWGLLTFFCLLSFSYLPLTVLGLMLGGSNLMGYIKCSREAKSQLSNFVMQKAMENPGMVASAATNMFSSTQPQK